MTLDIYLSKTSDLKPKDIKNREGFNLISYLLNDDFIKKFDPRKYIYYNKLNKIIIDPKELRKFMYTLKKVSEKKEQNDKITRNIVKLHDKLSFVDVESDNYATKKRNKIEQLNNKVNEALKARLNISDDDVDKSDKEDLIKEIVDTQKGGNNTDYLDKYSNKIENIVDGKDNDTVKIAKYKDVLNEIDNVINPTKTLDITKEDKILFIVITFIIRLVALNIVEWGFNTNYIDNFENAYLFYSIVYLLFIFIISCVVNITYNYSINSVLYGNTGFSILANSLYYFYIVPGASFQRNMRLIIHTLLMMIFLIIPYSLKTNENNNIDYDYLKKKKTSNLLYNYTFVVWIFTSIIAINF